VTGFGWVEDIALLLGTCAAEGRVIVVGELKIVQDDE
jgi:hypothetical protein